MFLHPGVKFMSCLLLHSGRSSHGFAYAPNFITKIIEETSGLSPVGLLDIPSRSDENKTTDPTARQDESRSQVSKGLLQGPITTRFPPEPNGYLHLGHAKAISFNFAVARAFKSGNGRCHMRLDDTNPSKEDEEYVNSILEDVRWIQQGVEPFENAPEQEGEDIGPWFGPVRKTSDYFHIIYDAAVYLINSGEAYVDELSADEIREYRGTLTQRGKESPFRNRSIEENLELFKNMRSGKFLDGECVLRAKIDMSSPNLNMRDPVLYRIKHESHQATGDDWCIYPMYDFSHPIADAVEGITHSLCTLEFEDHRPLYDWVADRILSADLVDCQPRQIEFSRLNLKYTILSKRKLIHLVEENIVSGWDDPRMPTLSGIRRRGVPPAALRLFCERVGISKSDSNIDFSILEDCAREILDEESSRAFAILKPLKVTLKNWEGSSLEDFEVPRHPKRKKLGCRTVPFGKTVFIERNDFFDLEGPEGITNGKKPPKGFKRLLPGGKVRLKYAYVVSCDEILRDPQTSEPIELICTLYPETRAGKTPEGETRVKGIIQWVEATTGVRCKVMQYDRLFKTEEPGKNSKDFTDDINDESLQMFEDVIVEPSVAMGALNMIAQIRSESITQSFEREKLYHSTLSYQFERSGYFALDSSSNADSLVFNRVVTLRDTWGVGKRKTPQKNLEKNSQNKNIVRSNGSIIADALRVALRVGTIVEVFPHPEADNLIICKLDCGDTNEEGESVGPRTAVAGLAGKMPFNELRNRRVVCVTNLKPAKIKGVESTAMILVASHTIGSQDEKVDLLGVPELVPNGELLSFEGMGPSKPDALLKSKGALKVWERVKSKLRVDEDGDVIYEDGNLRKLTTTAGPVKVDSLRNCMIG